MILPDEAALRQALLFPVGNEHRFSTRSDWIIDVIDDMGTDRGYNSDIQREVERRLGIDRQPDNGSVLSTLVYCAQQYRVERDIEARAALMRGAGYVPLTNELFDLAVELGFKLDVSGDVYTPRRINGRRALCSGRRRNRGIELKYGALTKIVGKVARADRLRVAIAQLEG